ncbi:MFS general substrate transporter [Cytidiella melzeri]|nr:MFS general substrate transporter [Cytidiella melzeri]
MSENHSQSTVCKQTHFVDDQPPLHTLSFAPSTDTSGKRQRDLEVAWRKMDCTVLPVVTVIFFLSFLDKGNIGNARIAGLQHELGMSDYQYTIALTVTFIPYILVELPSNLWLRRIGPNVLLPAMTTLWGIAVVLQGLVTSYSGLIACRFFIGLFEGGLLPGITLYLSSFYPKQKLQLRISLFFVSTTLAGAFSGLLASAIVHMDGVGHKPGWAWIFILEGLFTVLFGLLSFFVLPRTHAHVAFLTPVEKAYVEDALCEDELLPTFDHSSKEMQGGRVTRNDVWKAMRMVHVWLCVGAGFFNGATLSGLAYFLPSIVASLGYTSNEAQLMSVPPFAASFVLSIASSYLSDKYHKRGLTIILFALLGTSGFSLFLASSMANHPHSRYEYASLFLILPGTYSIAPPLAAWISNNTSPYTTRATAIALLTVSTNCGGVLATWVLGDVSSRGYRVGAWVFLGFQVGIVGCAGVCWGVLRRGGGYVL